MAGSSPGVVDVDVISQDRTVISMAAKALESTDSWKVGMLLVKVADWNKSQRQLLVSGLADHDPNVRYFCAMAFYVYASDLSYAEGSKAYDSVKNDVQAKTALQISAYLAIGWAKDSPPESALAIEQKFKSLLTQPKMEGSGQLPEQTTTPPGTFDTFRP